MFRSYSLRIFIMAKKKKQNLTVGFVALGCPKNVVDSEKMLAEIVKSGFFLTSEIDDSDVVIINTCGFIAPAREEALEVIQNAVALKNKGRVKKVIVTGCLPEWIGEKLFEQADGIDAIVGLDRRNDIAKIIEKTIASKKPLALLETGGASLSVNDDRARLLIGPPHRAYLRISEGCSRNCSFCTIPSIRGPFRSKPQQLVLAEAKELAESGVVELNVIGQDTTNWGADLKVKDGLAALAEELDKIDGLEWLRLLYLYPTGITDNLIETIARSKKITRYLDIPIQHINDDILRKMRRADTEERICQLIEKVRRALPDIVLRTTLIVGFPTETEKQFGQLVEFVKWARFDALGCFKYYAEQGTEAARMAGQVPEDTKQKRLEELMLIQQQIAFAKNKKRIGSELRCLVDSLNNDGTYEGRFYGQAPDIDSICITKNCSAQPGQFINTRVEDTKNYDLIVSQI